jgi:hypothetical protein
VVLGFSHHLLLLQVVLAVVAQGLILHSLRNKDQSTTTLLGTLALEYLRLVVTDAQYLDFISNRKIKCRKFLLL